MARSRFPLLSRVVVALAATSLLPLAISYYQLRSNRDALADQVDRTHIVASRAAASRVDAHLEGLLALARSTAAHPVMLASPRSAAAQELLSGTLVAQPSIALAGVFDPAGETVVMVRRSDMQEELGGLYETERAAGKASDEPAVSIVNGATHRWLRIRTGLPAGAGQLELLAEAENLSDKVQAFQIGEQALVALASRDDDMVFGGTDTLEAFPATAVEKAKTGKLDSGKSEHTDPLLGDVIVGHAQLQNAPWFVLSRQPAKVAKVAQEGIRRATLFAAFSAMLIMAALSAGAYLTIVRPIRRLAAAQSELAGGDANGGGSEIDRLEASFELLQRRVRDSEELGRVFLGRYQVTELIGSGAMGSVFRGRDPKLKRDLALKTIRINAENVDQRKLITGLLEEAAISARFHHPNIVTVYDVADQGNAAFIAMELVEGINLEKLIKNVGPQAPDQVIPLAAAIARALATAHEHDLVHHDVKPANVLLGRDGSIKVTDFGISELISASTRSDDMICGTPGYLAPECYLGDPYTPRADLFGLGLIIYEALVGKHPFQGRTLRETILNTATLEPEPIEHFRNDVSPELSDLAFALMAKRPADRPTSAAEVADLLEEMAHEQGMEWSPEPFDDTPSAEDEALAAGRTQLFTMSETG